MFRFINVFCLFLFLNGFAFADTSDFGNAVSGVLQAHLSASPSSSVSATLTAVSNELTAEIASAGSLTGLSATAVTWAVVAAQANSTGRVDLCCGYFLQFSSDYKTVMVGAMPVGGITDAMRTTLPGSDPASRNTDNENPPAGFTRSFVTYTDKYATCSGPLEDWAACMNNTTYLRLNAASSTPCASNIGYIVVYLFQGSTGPGMMVGGCYVNGGNMSNSWTGARVVPSGVATAAASLPSTVASGEPDATVVAAVVNKAWSAASSSTNYAGVAFSSSSPVTTTDVATYRATTAGTSFTSGAVLQPAASSSGAVTFSSSSGSSSSGGDTGSDNSCNGANNCNQTMALGGDPGVAAPSVDGSTASSVLQPVFDLFPSLRHFVVPDHSGVCPATEFSLFGKTFVLDVQCKLMEPVKSVLSPCCVVVWVVLSLVLFLSA